MQVVDRGTPHHDRQRESDATKMHRAMSGAVAGNEHECTHEHATRDDGESGSMHHDGGGDERRDARMPQCR